MKKILFFLFPFLVIIFLFHYFLVGQAVYGDGIYYWSYVRSIYIDHDILLNDEISHRYNHLHNNSLLPDVVPKEDAKRIALEYHLPFGAPLAWLPFFTVGNSIARVAHLFNSKIILNGYSDIYQITVGIGNILYILGGLFFVFLLVKKIFSQKIAILSTLFLLLTTNLFYYASVDVINSHPVIFFFSSLCVYYFFCKFSYKWHQWVFLGMLIGMLILTRTQEVLFGILLLFAMVRFWHTAHATILQKAMQTTFFLVLAVAGIVLIVSPQLVLFLFVYHGIFTSPYITQGQFSFLHPHILGMLLNGKTGLLFTSPSVLVGFVGLILLISKKRYIGLVGLTVFVLEYYLIASWSFWDQAASYGIRMLISTFPFFGIGMGYIVHIVSKKYSFKIIYIVGFLLFLFNMCMIVYFHLSIKTATYDITSVTRVIAQQKLNALLHTNFLFFKK